MKKQPTSADLIAWLHDHPLISVRGLERSCGIPDDTIRKAVEGVRAIPGKHIPSIIRALSIYGFG